jgi:hypothetical protein
MNKEKVIEIVNKHGINISTQFIEFAIKFNSEKLLDDFCVYWKSKPAGGGDLNKFFLENFKGKAGDL